MAKHKHKKREKTLSPQDEIRLIREKMGYVTFNRTKDSFEWLDLGHPDMNEALGDRERGIRWRSMIELHGWESHGKSLLSTILAVIAQRSDENVYVVKMDLENSDSEKFNIKMGLDLNRFYLFRPELIVDLADVKKKIGTRKRKINAQELLEKLRKEGKIEEYQQSAQQICDELEAFVKHKKRQNEKAKFIIIIDSVTGLLVEEEYVAGLTDQNMRTNVSLASFLTDLCRRWTGFIDNYDCIVFFINQLREKPGQLYGNPEYSPGGKALKFYCSVRVKVQRAKDGRMKKHGKIIGIRSYVRNIKNKCGGTETHKAGFKAYTRKGKFKFISAEATEKEARKDKGEKNAY
jgi:RecA/RadA recombinase